jgi:hypothetical protein
LRRWSVLAECGYDVEVQKNVKLARGDVDIDVWADDHSGPPNVIAIECKRWKTSVRRTWCTRSPRAACASANEHHFIEAGGDELTAW